MSRMITLVDKDAQGTPNIVLGNALLPSDDPVTPEVLIYKKKIYQSNGPSYTPEPGQYETYQVCGSLELPDGALAAPEAVPTDAWWLGQK